MYDRAVSIAKTVITAMALQYVLRRLFLPSSTTSAKRTKTDDGRGGRNAWRSGQEMDMLIFLSEDERFERDDSILIWHETGLTYDCAEENQRDAVNNVTLPEGLAERNASLFGHIFFVRNTPSESFDTDRAVENNVVYKRYPMVRFEMRQRKPRLRNLLSGETDGDVEEEEEEQENIDVLVPHWIPSLHVNLVHDFSRIKKGNRVIPKIMMDEMQYHPRTKNYLPPLYVNDLFLTREQLIEMNDTVKSVPLTMTYGCMTMMRWQMYLQMADSWRRQTASGLTGKKDIDEMRRLITETNPVLLGVTAVVSLLHMIFDCLAFKSDIQFWRQTKSLKGLSMRALSMSLFFKTIIFLYLLDNETTWMVLFSRGMGLIIEVWKMRKAMNVHVATSFPFLTITSKISYAQSKTKKYDDYAMEHLLYVLYPACVGFTCYSVIYSQHRSWYSFVISSMVSFIYIFGFVMMTPQIFMYVRRYIAPCDSSLTIIFMHLTSTRKRRIAPLDSNYKLKSVKHLPWRAMVYRSLNTFIDDLFAFVVKMPTLHRLACFRDDIIFFILLYQRWIYPVDHTRRLGDDKNTNAAKTTTAGDSVSATDGEAKSKND